MKYMTITLAVLTAALALACAKSSTKVDVDESTEAIAVDPKLPHDFPHALVPPNATYTHGSTGMMKAEANPEGNAYFETDASVEVLARFYENLEAWVVESKETTTSEYGEHCIISIRESAELSSLQARIELTPFSDDDGNLRLLIHVAYRGQPSLKLDIEEP